MRKFYQCTIGNFLLFSMTSFNKIGLLTAKLPDLLFFEESGSFNVYFAQQFHPI